MSEMNTVGIEATLGAGALILNDYLIQIAPIEGGSRMTVSKGSETQTMDVLDGRSAYQAAAAAGYKGTEAEFEAAMAQVPSVTGAEAERIAAETRRVQNEQARQSAESARQSGETDRIAAETARQSAETARQSAETARSTAETTRQSAETGRAEAFAGYESRIDAATPDDDAMDGRPWTSKKIVDMLCPPVHESGNPVQCYPVTGYPLGVNVSWEPEQEGEGDPSPDNVRPISGRNSVRVTLSGEDENSAAYDIALPETVYGGTLDAATGEGAETWKIVVLDGSENWKSWGVNFLVEGHTGFYLSAINDYSVTEADKSLCSHYKFNRGTYGGANLGLGLAESQSKYCIISVQNDALADVSSTDAAIESFKSFLAAQYAAGTPIQIAYKLAEPVPFTAAGGGTISALPGLNTLYTDADALTVTGRADPVHIIRSLADRVAALEETKTTEETPQ